MKKVGDEVWVRGEVIEVEDVTDTHRVKMNGEEIWVRDEDIQQTPEYKKGDWVLVRDSDKEKWRKNMFAYIHPNSIFPYRCVCKGDENTFISGQGVGFIGWKQIKPLPKTKVPPALVEWAESYKNDDLKIGEIAQLILEINDE